MNVLKKVLFTSIIGILASFSSNDYGKEVIPSSIIGNWEVTSVMSDGVEYVESGDCLSYYFIKENSARYLEYFQSNNDCIADWDDYFDYPILEYIYNGETFIFDGSTFQIIEVTKNTIKWSKAYQWNNNSRTNIETLRRK